VTIARQVIGFQGLTSLMIALNRRYTVPGYGIRITGVSTQS
jgi:hypothetical protein